MNPTSRERKIVSLYKSGKSYREISLVFKCSTTPIQRVIRNSGVEIRPSHTASGKFSGEKSHKWKGGEVRTVDGRVKIYKPNHHKASSSGYVFRYVLVWEKYNKKRVPRGLDIHHKNGICDDDRPENLQAITRSKHRRHHMKAIWAKSQGGSRMRQYQNFPEALNEIKRDLSEMGIQLRTKSVQNLDISNDPSYSMLEIQNYSYVVTSPDWKSIPLENKEYFEAEFAERTCGLALNPGKAWELDKEYWGPFRRPSGNFDYAYPERMADPLRHVIEALRQDPNTRRAYLPIFHPTYDFADNFKARIPCSLGYLFQFRQGQLNITYLQRSADWSKHFNKDIALADRLKCYVAEQCGMKPGYFCHWVGSLHVFAKDVAGTF